MATSALCKFYLLLLSFPALGGVMKNIP